jgi:hypothetical protein
MIPANMGRVHSKIDGTFLSGTSFLWLSVPTNQRFTARRGEKPQVKSKHSGRTDLVYERVFDGPIKVTEGEDVRNSEAAKAKPAQDCPVEPTVPSAIKEQFHLTRPEAGTANCTVSVLPTASGG